MPTECPANARAAIREFRGGGGGTRRGAERCLKGVKTRSGAASALYCGVCRGLNMIPLHATIL